MYRIVKFTRNGIAGIVYSSPSLALTEGLVELYNSMARLGGASCYFKVA